MKILDMVQQSPEWYKAKAGIPSSSDFSRILQMNGKPSKSQKKYLFQLAGEKILGCRPESYQSKAMLRGTIVEEEARQHYEFIKGVEVQQVGFCLTDDEMVGSSTDGLVGEDGCIEIKSPEKIEIQVERLLLNKLPSDAYQQVQGSLFVTGRKWCDYISYYPGLPSLIIRVYPDKAFHKALEIELTKFNKELLKIVEEIS